MTNALDRATIVGALKTVATLSVHATTPDTIAPMVAWPAWSSTEWLNACATSSTWYVFVALPNANTESTVDAADDVMEDVAAALWPVCKITRREPWRVPLEAGQQTLPVVRFTLEI